MEENRFDHNIAARATSDYLGDIELTDELGKVHHTAQSSGGLDGTGATRSYDHKNKGTRSCLVVFSLHTGRPMMVVYYSVRLQYCF